MKSHSALVLLFPLLAVGYLGIESWKRNNQLDMKENKPVPSVTDIEQVNDNRPTPTTSLPFAQRAAFSAELRENEEYKKSLNNSIAKAASQINVDELVSREVKRRQSHFKELFNKWKLDVADEEKILGIIHERERILANIRMDTFKRGMSVSVSNGKRIQIERDTFGAELLLLMGENRYKEFEEMDSSLNSRGLKDSLARNNE